MRFTAPLNRQHIGFMFKKHWLVQGKRQVINTEAAETLKARKVPITNPFTYLWGWEKTNR